MPGRLTYVAVAILGLHGLVHFLGPVAYFEIATLSELPYKTTLLDGAVDVGDTGIRLFGLLWVVAGVGFLASAWAVGTGWEHWEALLLAVTIVSLVLTGLDWTVAYAGLMVDLGILAALGYQTYV